MPTIKITDEEACLIDYLITLHTYDFSLLELLKQPLFVQLREKAGKVIISGEKEQPIDLTSEEVAHLLIVTPITFRFLENDVGFSLKEKLFSIILPKPIKIDLSMFEEEKPKKEEKSDEPVATDNNTSTDGSTYLPFCGS